MKESENSFLKGFILAPLPLVLLFILFVVLVDPFWRFGSPAIPGFNALKIYVTHQVRLSKAHLACDVKPRAAVFGSSRIEQGFMMDHPVWKQIGPGHNMGMGGMMIDELFQTVRHTYYASGGRLKTVIVGLDFFAFNALRQKIIFDKIVVNFDADRLLKSEGDSCAAAFIHDADFFLGMKALKASLETIPDQYHHNGGHPQYYQRNGAYHPTLNALHQESLKSSVGQISIGAATGYVSNVWRPEGSRRYCFKTEEFDSFDSFRKLLDFAAKHDIDLRLFFSPMHAWLDVSLKEAGLSFQYMKWKETVASLVEEEAGKHKDAQLELWDFSGFNPITTSDVTQKTNPWYYEGTHYRPALGDLILDCMYGTHVAGEENKKGFCRRASAASVKERNRRDMKALPKYEAEHEEELKPLKKYINGIFAKEPGSNCGPTYHYLQEASREAARQDGKADYAAILAKAESLYRGEERAYEKAGVVFREPDPANTFLQQQAQALEAAGKAAEAIELYWLYAEKYSESDALLEKIGYLAAQNNDHADAERAFTTLIAHHPENITYYYQRAQSRMQAQEWEGAIADSDKGLSMQPENVEFHLFRAEARLRTGRIEGGMQDIAFVRAHGVDSGHIRGLVEQFAQKQQ